MYSTHGRTLTASAPPWRGDSPASDVQRAAWFYQLIRYSYASGLTSFGSQPHDMRSNFSLIEQAHGGLPRWLLRTRTLKNCSINMTGQ